MILIVTLSLTSYHIKYMLYTIKYIERKILLRIVYPLSLFLHYLPQEMHLPLKKESFTGDNTESFYSQPIYYDQSCLTL